MTELRLTFAEAHYLRRHVSAHCMSMGHRTFDEMKSVLSQIPALDEIPQDGFVLRLNAQEHLILRRNLFCTHLACFGRSVPELTAVLERFPKEFMPTTEAIVLPADHFRAVTELLDNPPAPSEALVDLMQTKPVWSGNG